MPFDPRGAGSATLSLQWAYPAFWGESDLLAGYLDRFAIRRDLHGRELGAHLLDLAQCEVLGPGARFLGWTAW